MSRSKSPVLFDPARNVRSVSDCTFATAVSGPEPDGTVCFGATAGTKGSFQVDTGGRAIVGFRLERLVSSPGVGCRGAISTAWGCDVGGGYSPIEFVPRE